MKSNMRNFRFAFFLLVASAILAGGEEAKANFSCTKSIRGLWELRCDDNKFIYSRLKTGSPDKVETVEDYPDESIADSESNVALWKSLDGWRMKNGRLFKSENTGLQYFYDILFRAYAIKGDCEKSKQYMKEYFRLADARIQSVLWFPLELTDPDIDADIYEDHRKGNYPVMSIYHTENKCFTLEEFESRKVPYSASLEDSGAMSKNVSATKKKILSDMNLSSDDELFFEKYLVYAADAHNAVKTDPQDAISKAQALLKWNASFAGKHFNTGTVYRPESYLMIDTRAILMNAFAAAVDCNAARAELDKIRTLSESQYLVVDFFRFHLYDPAAMPADEFSKMKARDLKILRQYAVVGNCISSDQLDAAYLQ